MKKFLAMGALALVCGVLAAPARAETSPQETLAAVSKAAKHSVFVGSKVRFETTKGKFTVALFPREAPQTVANFEKLVKKGYYNGLSFHRVIPGFVAQGGDPKGDGSGGPGWSIPDERNPLIHLPGAVAMAKAGPNTAGSQFYVTLERIPHLDGGYTVFGQVIEGFNTVKKLNATEGSGASGKPDKMLKVYLVK